MDIIISDKWLREYLDTKASPQEISEYISLCGPSIERLEEKDGDILYHVEITTNRIDCVGVWGFAREVAAILPRFKIPAKLRPFTPNPKLGSINNLPFSVTFDNKLVKRTTGVILTNINSRKSPIWMQKRLLAAGLRSLNALVDITNYVMLETGQPCHAFDYDKIKNKKFVIRQSKKGETVTSFDGKTYQLTGNDIVFDDGEGEIIDLPGIIGTKNSVVDDKTESVLFFIDNNEPSKIRHTSMSLAIRTMAASINEKGVDPELAKNALLRGIELYQNICKANLASKIFDTYPKPYKAKSVKTTLSFIQNKLGVNISKEDISDYLTSLEFDPKWDKETLLVCVPSFRSTDINIAEDIVEEVARIYGYHNLPSVLMNGVLPKPQLNNTFELELRIKNTLKALGGIEVYTLSLVSADYVDINKSLKLKNPLGGDTQYLKTHLTNSLINAVSANNGVYDKIFLYEIANVYTPQPDNLPNEKMVLGMCFDGYKFTEIKGIVETLLSSELHIDIEINKKENAPFLSIYSKDMLLGNIVEHEDAMVTVELEIETLSTLFREFRSFKPIPKYPAQIEDITIKIPQGVLTGKVIQTIKSASNIIADVEHKDVYKDSHTFRVSYQDPQKTLNDSEVAEVRKVLALKLKEKYSIEI